MQRSVLEALVHDHLADIIDCRPLIAYLHDILQHSKLFGRLILATPLRLKGICKHTYFTCVLDSFRFKSIAEFLGMLGCIVNRLLL